MRNVIIIVIVLLTSVLGWCETSGLEKGFGFLFDSNGGFSAFFTNDDNNHYNPTPNPYQPQPSPNTNPTYQNDLQYIISKYGINGKIVPMFQNNVCVGTALLSGREMYRVSYVLRIEEIDGMRIQLPMTRNGNVVDNVNVVATQYGNVAMWRKKNTGN